MHTYTCEGRSSTACLGVCSPIQIVQLFGDMIAAAWQELVFWIYYVQSSNLELTYVSRPAAASAYIT